VSDLTILITQDVSLIKKNKFEHGEVDITWSINPLESSSQTRSNISGYNMVH